MQDMDFLKSFHTAAQLLPERLWKAAYSLDEQQRQQCEELRVRLGRPLAATVAGKTVLLGVGAVLPTKEELDQLLARADEINLKREEVKDRISALRQSRMCASCGTACGRDDTFCKHCGAHL